MSELVLVGLVVAVALAALAVWMVPVARLRRRARSEGGTLGWREATGLMVRGTPPPGFFGDAARIQALKPDVPLEALSLHALAGGRLDYVAEALEAQPDADLEALCVVDLMRGDVLEAARSGDAAGWLREALGGSG